MHEKLSPEAEKVLKTQYESLKKEGKTNPDEIGDALMATIRDLKQKEQEQRNGDDASKETGQFRYYTNDYISYSNGANYYGESKQRRYLVINKKTKKVVDSRKHQNAKTREGYGIMRFENGDVYKGSWMNDMLHGEGVMTFKSGDVYEGAWFKNMMTTGKDPDTGKPTDIGVLKFHNGDVYEGEFKCGMFEGQGVYRRSDGTIDHDGLWHHGKPFTRPHKRIWVHNGYILKEECECKDFTCDHVDDEFLGEDYLGRYEGNLIHIKKGTKGKTGPCLLCGDRKIDINQWADRLDQLTYQIAIDIIEGREVTIDKKPKRTGHKRKDRSMESPKSAGKSSNVIKKEDQMTSSEDGTLHPKSQVIHNSSENKRKSRNKTGAVAGSTVAHTKSGIRQDSPVTHDSSENKRKSMNETGTFAGSDAENSNRGVLQNAIKIVSESSVDADIDDSISNIISKTIISENAKENDEGNLKMTKTSRQSESYSIGK